MGCPDTEGDTGLAREVTNHNSLEGIMKRIILFAEEIICNVKFNALIFALLCKTCSTLILKKKKRMLAKNSLVPYQMFSNEVVFSISTQSKSSFIFKQKLTGNVK